MRQTEQEARTRKDEEAMLADKLTCPTTGLACGVPHVKWFLQFCMNKIVLAMLSDVNDIQKQRKDKSSNQSLID